jgi:lipopolysaccharide/colanic/teichoic acid biosynthesis glycosyltransferase
MKSARHIRPRGGAETMVKRERQTLRERGLSGKEEGIPLLLDQESKHELTNEYRALNGHDAGEAPCSVHVYPFARFIDPACRHRWYPALKAVTEITVALGLFVLALPVVLAVVLIVKLTSRGPGFYSQVRVGKDGRLFTIYKIRTMLDNCESVSGPCWSAPGDPRVTRIGRFLRKSHLDELPQLVNVICGEMSLIGPRPERPEFLPLLDQAIPDYRQRLAVRPGVTGLAQVQLPADTDLDSVRQKLAYDIYYIRSMSPWLDMQILAATATYVVGLPFRISQRVFLLPARDTVARQVSDALFSEPTSDPELCLQPAVQQ